MPSSIHPHPLQGRKRLNLSENYNQVYVQPHLACCTVPVYRWAAKGYVGVDDVSVIVGCPGVYTAAFRAADLGLCRVPD